MNQMYFWMKLKRTIKEMKLEERSSLIFLTAWLIILLVVSIGVFYYTVFIAETWMQGIPFTLIPFWVVWVGLNWAGSPLAKFIHYYLYWSRGIDSLVKEGYRPNEYIVVTLDKKSPKSLQYGGEPCKKLFGQIDSIDEAFLWAYWGRTIPELLNNPLRGGVNLNNKALSITKAGPGVLALISIHKRIK